MDNIQHLETIYIARGNDEDIVLRKFNDGEDPTFSIAFLEGTYTVAAVYWFYAKKDVDSAKSNFFKAASVAKYMSEKYDRKVMDSGINQISYAMLSDNPGLIEKYSTLRNSKNHELNIGFQLPNAVQNILLDRMEDLKTNIRNLERFVQVPRFKSCASFIDVFNGFLSSDEKKIEAGLQLMLKTHKKRNTDPLISKFLSVDTAGLCKLAWLKGFEIDLKDDLVPTGLMPIRPLKHYEESQVLKTLS